MPEKVWIHIRKKGKKEWKVSFLAAVLFGLAAHMYKLTNTLPNWDSLVNYHTSQDTTYLGRWFLRFVCGISSDYDLPWLNGLLSLFYLGLCSVCICELFRVKKKAVLILGGGLLAVFPTVTSTLAYSYTADGYFAGLLCMCLGIFLFIRVKKGLPAGIILLALGMGIYQAYLTFAMLLVLFYLLDSLLFRERPVGEVWRTALRCLLGGVCGCLLYWAVLKGILAFSGIRLSSYQGIQSAFSLSEIHAGRAVRQCLRAFQRYFFDVSQGINLFLILNLLAVYWGGVSAAEAVLTKRMYRDIKRCILALACVCLLPFASYALYFQSSVEYHSLMVMGNCLYYLFLLVLYERSPREGGKLLILRQWGILGVGGALCFYFILISNISYQKMQLAYEKSYAAVIRIADRIEQTEGAKNCTSIAVIGGMPGANQASSVNLPPIMTGVTDTYIIWGQDEITAMLKDYLGIDLRPADEEQREEIQNTQTFREMGKWPEEGAVAVEGDTVVIRLPGPIKNDREDMTNERQEER